MPRISSNLLDCALYLYQSKEDARNGESIGGSGFLFPLAYPDDCVKGIHVYAVTNNHLVCQNPSFPVIRLRRRDGSVVVIDPRETGEEWTPHPNGDDLAVCLLHLEASEEFRLSTPLWHFRPLPETPGQDEFGEILGREAVMIGRFIGHDGKETNIPALRFGNVSALPVEPIEHQRFGIKQESFIVEMRSLSGFSGSPVFILPDPWKQMRVDPIRTKLVEWKASLDSPYKPNPIMDVRNMTLLGVNWCHLDSPPQRIVNRDGEPVEDLYTRLNSGMAGVVPWWKLWELFDDPSTKSVRKAIEDKAQK